MQNENPTLKRRNRLKKKLSRTFYVVLGCLIFSIFFFISSVFLTPVKMKDQKKKMTENIQTNVTPPSSTPKPHPSTKPRAQRFQDIKVENRAPRIPVLLYQDIQDIPHSDSPNIITKKDFEAQMIFLKDNGFTTITTDEFIDAYNGKINLPKKSVLLTFDSGYVSLKKYVNPFLIRHNLNATGFIIGNHTNNPKKYLSEKDIYNIQIDRKFDIESQSFNLYNNDTAQSTLAESTAESFQADNQKNEKLIGHKIRFFSYPLGTYTPAIIENLKAANIQFAFATKAGKADWVELNDTKISPFGDAQNPLSLPRITVKNDISIEQYKKNITDELS